MVTRYARYRHAGRVAHGILEGDTIRQLSDSPFSATARPDGVSLGFSEVELLAPCQPSKVIAVGLNFKSHLRGRPAPAYPGLFAKLPTSVIGPDDPIVIPHDAERIHYEGELVVVIGKTARRVPVSAASDHIFGVTAGNDVSERVWQRSDLQWLRAKGSDTFAPIGPLIAAGLDYSDLLIQTRLNGELRQAERSRDLLFDVDTLVSYVSRYITLVPGDLIFTGTPGTTSAMKPGDLVEVEVEGVGVLRNPVALDED